MADSSSDPQMAADPLIPAGGVPDLADIHVEDHDGVAVVSISGEVDVSNVDRLAQALTGLSNLPLGLVLDLSDLGYLDSSGIALLHDLALRLRQRMQRLIIVCPPGSPPRRMLELAGLGVRSPVFDELAPAIASVRAEHGDPC